MEERFQKFIKPLIIGAVIIFVVCYFVKVPVTFEDYFSYVGYSISGVTVMFLVYERWVWRIIPWNRPPVLKKHYHGIIRYSFKKESRDKTIDITVKQTLLSVRVETKTDINSSYTVLGIITTEYGNSILYYTYITNPSAAVQRQNPIQYGTCRMVLNEENTAISGKYWTSSQTIGDIEWQESDD